MKSFVLIAIVFTCCIARYAGGQDLSPEKQSPPSAQEGISAAEVLDNRVEFVVDSLKTNGAVDDAVFKTE
jgi:hypothetical protein